MKKIQNITLLSRFVHSRIPLFLSVSSIGIYTLIKGKMVLENLLASIDIFDTMSASLSRLPIFITTLLNCLISLSRLEKFLNSKDSKKTSKEDIALKQQNIDIKLNNCNFGVFNSDLKKYIWFRFRNKKGELVAVLGETGSGKTCLVNAILNYLGFIPKSNNLFPIFLLYIKLRLLIKNGF